LKHGVGLFILAEIKIGEYMKNLIALFTLTISINSFATCSAPEGDLGSVYDGYDNDQTEYLYNETSDNGKIPFPGKLFSQYPSLGEFDAKECADAVTESVIKNKKTGISYVAVYTIEDNCDGGNSYGLLFNEDKSKVVATINDGDFYCID